MGAVLDALSAYTERHMARMDRLRRSVCLLDYTLGCMHVIEETALRVRNIYETISFSWWSGVPAVSGCWACILGCRINRVVCMLPRKMSALSGQTQLLLKGNAGGRR